MPAYPAAARALEFEDGVGEYLRAQGETKVPTEPRSRADLTLRVFVSRIFSDADEFVLTQERFDRAWRELAAALHEGGAECVVVAPLLGVAIGSREVPLGDGLSLMAPEALDDAPRDALRITAERGVLAVVAHPERPGAPGAHATAIRRLERTVRALRLFDSPSPALGGVAWTRTGTGPWTVTGMQGGGRARGLLAVPATAEDELRAFCSLVDRRASRTAEIGWALTATAWPATAPSRSRRSRTSCSRCVRCSSPRARRARGSAAGSRHCARSPAGTARSWPRWPRRSRSSAPRSAASPEGPRAPTRSSPGWATTSARCCATSSAGTSTPTCAG